MKFEKTTFRFFSIFQWKQEQEYLREQHQQGWKFIKVNFFGLYHFEKCDPEDVIYQLDYNPDGLAHKAEYIRLFEDCGWEYLQDYVGYSYFRKAASNMDGDEEIFCDDASRTDMMKRVFKGRVIPLLPIFLLIIIPNLFFYNHISTSDWTIITGLFGVLFILYLFLFAFFGIEYWKYTHK